MKKGFTIAEVLITLGIIGVVAVLTVPSVMQSYKNRLYVTQLKKVYLDINSAAEALLRDEGVDNFGETKAALKKSDESQGSQYFLTKYFTYADTKKCGTDEGYSTSCQYKFTSKIYDYESIYGDEITGGLVGDYCILTKYGAIICMYQSYSNSDVFFDVDVNGIQEPNIAGRDAYTFKISPKGADIYDVNPNAGQCNKKNGGWQNVAAYAAGCFQSIMENNWTMNY